MRKLNLKIKKEREKKKMKNILKNIVARVKDNIIFTNVTESNTTGIKGMFVGEIVKTVIYFYQFVDVNLSFIIKFLYINFRIILGFVSSVFGIAIGTAYWLLQLPIFIFRFVFLARKTFKTHAEIENLEKASYKRPWDKNLQDLKEKKYQELANIGKTKEELKAEKDKKEWDELDDFGDVIKK